MNCLLFIYIGAIDFPFVFIWPYLSKHFAVSVSIWALWLHHSSSLWQLIIEILLRWGFTGTCLGAINGHSHVKQYCKLFWCCWRTLLIKDNWLNCSCTTLLFFIDRINECCTGYQYWYANGRFYESIYLHLAIIVRVQMKLVLVCVSIMTEISKTESTFRLAV